MEAEGLDQGSPTNILKDSGEQTLRKAEHGAPSEGTSFSGVFMSFSGPPRKDSTQAATYESRRRNTGEYVGIYPT